MEANAGREIVRKKANAKLRPVGRGLDSIITGALDQLAGGTWVGGEVVITTDAIRFAANRLNRAIQTGELDATIPLSAVAKAGITGGIGTKIITAELLDGSQFQFRCTGARDVLTLLDAQLDATRQR